MPSRGWMQRSASRTSLTPAVGSKTGLASNPGTAVLPTCSTLSTHAPDDGLDARAFEREEGRPFGIVHDHVHRLYHNAARLLVVAFISKILPTLRLPTALRTMTRKSNRGSRVGGTG